ncbi:MAG: 1-deoxy-D-xylulose-5-phosphate reductoisomerase [bacterium]|jgi:1-deoxy-D-xylulose-5-phosphate reductoisomerase|nr:1-deoxy-D-xylulose-5-phosphate reductoisomerase [candidate division KSB1 bacterium]MDH7559838.1 1-deoxy-D-xylulose-5-phosphate reductoisomerase [bacterium]
MARKRLAILGSTGSIGRSCLQVVDGLGDEFVVAYLATLDDADIVAEQAVKYHAQAVAIASGRCPEQVRQQLQQHGVEVWLGPEATMRVAAAPDYDLLVNAVLGAAGLLPTLAAIDQGKSVALANKETLVAGGVIVMRRAAERRVPIIPIDSEHSALLQCLMGEDRSAVRRLILTASGGPFLDLDPALFSQVTVEQALAHPNWRMGPKITIDSATLMNKGLEVIEAHWLFAMPVAKVDVVIHPQSIVHSLVEFVDGSVKAQLGAPDMHLPIQFALTYPERRPGSWPRLDLTRHQRLEFRPPDLQRFPCLSLAYQAARTGGTLPAVMNAANEVAVAMFLGRKITFDRIPQLIEQTMAAHTTIAEPSVEDILASDAWARAYVESLCHR